MVLNFGTVLLLQIQILLVALAYGSHITQDTFLQKINAKEAETKGLELSLKYNIIPLNGILKLHIHI